MSEPPQSGKPPEHLSHSSRETLERCAKSWFLKYIARAPQQPAVWSVGGSAVHETTEHYDLMSMAGNADAFQLGFTWERLFDGQLAKLSEKEPEQSRWRRSRTDDVEAWRRMGPGLVQSYIDWRESARWEIWTTPDGEPAIELDISGRLPGCPVEIKGILDRIFWDPMFKKLWILDLKTGKRAPSNADQFGVYRALAKEKYGVEINDGAAFMNRKGTLGKPYDLSAYTPEFVGAAFGEAWEQIQRSEFPATGIQNRGCFICEVSAACYAKGGPLAAYYDPDSPGFQPPL
ncbi:PD-(D/E)XK nuclease family protein [Streptomyces sp. NPDC047821]|uniref:PD-(D/E)XK nuclease family protein n=1 Tax=Streptomyces sp. NPDC047821 TaxID=3365488 RepID=UPI00371989A5